MTAMVVLDANQPLDEVIEISSEDIDTHQEHAFAPARSARASAATT